MRSIVSGSEYSGFEGAVTYLSGFQIVHRYAYVVVPEGETFVVFPREARYVGEHGTTPIEQVFADRPGEEIAPRGPRPGWRRLGVYGLDYVMTVRDYRALGHRARPFDVEFDLARAVKSEAELESVRECVRINEAGSRPCSARTSRARLRPRSWPPPRRSSSSRAADG